MTLVYVPKKNVGVKEPCRAHHDDEGIPCALRQGQTSQLLPLLGKCSLYKTGCTQDALLLLGGGWHVLGRQ